MIQKKVKHFSFPNPVFQRPLIYPSLSQNIPYVHQELPHRACLERHLLRPDQDFSCPHEGMEIW